MTLPSQSGVASQVPPAGACHRPGESRVRAHTGSCKAKSAGCTLLLHLPSPNSGFDPRASLSELRKRAAPGPHLLPWTRGWV